jgi:hypothetical protein
MDQAAIYTFMTQFRYGVISSTSRGGTSQSALVGIAVTQNLEIVFDTVRSSRKYPNLIERPTCSFVAGWGGEQTVQLEGVATEPEGTELERALEVFCHVARWPTAYFAARHSSLRCTSALDSLQRLRPNSATDCGDELPRLNCKTSRA